MKTLKIFSALIVISFASFSQSLFVDTLPHNKNVLFEEFTGVQCNSCPQGHIEIANLLAAYPLRTFAAGMHSYVTGHTTPYPNEENLRRLWPDNLWNNHISPGGIPSGLISRRNFSGAEGYIWWPFPSFHKPIDSCTKIVLAEPSPFNIGIKANYDSINNKLYVDAQVYTTANCSGNYRLNVYFTESNILVSQLNGNTIIPNYNEKHVFREILTPTWGTNMAPSGSLKGNVYNSSFTYSNSNSPLYKMQNVEVLVFVTDHLGNTSPKGTVVQVNGISVTKTGAITTGIQETTFAGDDVLIAPNPSSQQFTVFSNRLAVGNEIIVCDVSGKIVLKKETGTQNSVVVEHDLAPGIYFLSLKNNPGVIKKIVIN